MLFNVIDNSPANVDDIKQETQKDECLKQVYVYSVNGWPKIVDERFTPYKKKRESELSVENEFVLWGSRIIIPMSLQNGVLNTLDDAHWGASEMKSSARSSLWWPYMDADIEPFVKLCQQCQKHGKNPAKAPLYNCNWLSESWKRIHVYFAGPFMNKMFLIVIGGHSKWIEIKMMNSITSADLIIELKVIFSYHQLCDQILSDNGPNVTGQEFK